MKYWFADGRFNVSDTRGNAGGYLVIYGDTAKFSIHDTIGHDDLLKGIAVSKALDKSVVLDKGIRLFFVYTKDGVAISGVRRIDNERIASDPAGYARIIRKVLK